MLKAEIDGEGVPEKGTPQGGLLSPLLSLIVLNELYIGMIMELRFAYRF